MAYCSTCGAAAGGRFCPRCGAAMGASMGTNMGTAARDIPPHIAAAACYVLPVIAPVVCLLVDPFRSDRNIRFHAFQSLLVSVCFFLAGEVAGLLDIGTPEGGSLLLSQVVYRLLRLATVVLSLYLAYKTYLRQQVILPGIGPFAAKQV